MPEGASGQRPDARLVAAGPAADVSGERATASMGLPHCAIGISFSMSFAMSCQRRESSLRSQAARASTPFIVREISRASFSNLPILIQCTAERRRMGEGHRCHECTRAHCPGRLAFGLANRISRRDYLHQHDPHLTLGGDCWIDQRGARHTPSGIAVLPLRSLHMRRLWNGPEQPSIRPEPRDRNPNRGLRDLEAVAASAQSVGFSAPVVTEMPANNLSVCSIGSDQDGALVLGHPRSDRNVPHDSRRRLVQSRPRCS
jgi:hypothetical protein